MDNYPDHLGIELEMGSIAIPFMEWWSQTKSHFPNIPENVAEQWLHRHWNNTPFGYLKSKNYDFDLCDFPSSSFADVLSCQADFASNVADRIEEGCKSVERAEYRPWSLAKSMLDYRDFPTPIINCDNADGHLVRDEEQARAEKIPEGLILIEGHKRLDIASYLISEGNFRSIVKVWIMRRRQRAISAPATTESDAE